MKIHQQRSAAREIEELYAIAVLEHGPQGRSSKMLKQELDRELRRAPDAGISCEKSSADAGRAAAPSARSERWR